MICKILHARWKVPVDPCELPSPPVIEQAFSSLSLYRTPMLASLLTPHHRTIAVTLLLGFSGLIACSRKDQTPADTNQTTASTAGESTGMAMGAAHDTSMRQSMSHDSAMAGMSGMTNDPDRDFLRMMSDHHKGLILMAHETLERTDKLGVKAEAKALDEKQDRELDQMVTMLEQHYHDPYTPHVSPDNQAMVDSLTPLSGAAYDHAFRQNVITHHRQGIQMIDQFLPKLKNTSLKAMAEKMKADHTKEIAQFQRELSKH